MVVAAYPLLSRAEQAFAAGRHEEAAALVMDHVRGHPQEPRGMTLLGVVAIATGALVQGEHFLRRALALSPENMTAKRELASCLSQQERIMEALEAFAPLQGRGDTAADIRVTLLLDKLGRHSEARAILDRLTVDEAGNPVVWNTFGHHLRAAGQTGEAVAAYRKAIAIDPEFGDAWWGLASIKQKLLGPDDIATMEGTLAAAKDPAPIHFALGRAYDGQRDYERAMHHFSEANRLWNEALRYDPEQLTREVTDTERLFTADRLATLPAGGDPSPAPIFIVGLPRSGTTLLEQMLGSHSSVEPLGELPYIPAMLRSVMEMATRAGIRGVPEALAQLSPADRQALGADYLKRAAAHRKTDRPFFVDKLPHNWSNAVMIRLILPNARIVDIRRDPMTCCWSNFSHSFSRAHASSFSLTGIGRAYVDYVRLMDHLSRALPGYVKHLRYEELVDSPKPVLSALLDSLALPWEEAVLRFNENERVVRTPSAEQVRRPLNREGMDTWRPYQAWLGPLKKALGSLAPA